MANENIRYNEWSVIDDTRYKKVNGLTILAKTGEQFIIEPHKDEIFRVHQFYTPAARVFPQFKDGHVEMNWEKLNKWAAEKMEDFSEFDPKNELEFWARCFDSSIPYNRKRVI